VNINAHAHFGDTAHTCHSGFLLSFELIMSENMRALRVGAQSIFASIRETPASS
jgi:hypothetical protein